MNLLLPITNTLSCPPSNPCLLAPCQSSPTAAPTVPLCSSGCHGCRHVSSFLIPPPPARARLLSAAMPAGLIKGFLFSPRAAPDPKAHSCDGKGAGHISSMSLLHQEWDRCCPGATAASPRCCFPAVCAVPLPWTHQGHGSTAGTTPRAHQPAGCWSQGTASGRAELTFSLGSLGTCKEIPTS